MTNVVTGSTVDIITHIFSVACREFFTAEASCSLSKLQVVCNFMHSEPEVLTSIPVFWPVVIRLVCFTSNHSAAVKSLLYETLKVEAIVEFIWLHLSLVTSLSMMEWFFVSSVELAIQPFFKAHVLFSLIDAKLLAISSGIEQCLEPIPFKYLTDLDLVIHTLRRYMNLESELHVLVSVKNIFAILQQLLCPAAELDADNGQEDDESIPINMLQKDIAAAIITIVFDLVQKNQSVARDLFGGIAALEQLHSSMPLMRGAIKLQLSVPWRSLLSELILSAMLPSLPAPAESVRATSAPDSKVPLLKSSASSNKLPTSLSRSNSMVAKTHSAVNLRQSVSTVSLTSQANGNGSSASSRHRRNPVKESASLRGSNSAQKSPQYRMVLEFCRRGTFKMFLWNLVHTDQKIRHINYKILRRCLLICESSKGAGTTVSQSFSIMWSSFVEQGLIPFLYMLSEGYIIERKPSNRNDSVLQGSEGQGRFPEQCICRLAAKLLYLCQHTCADNPGVLNLANSLMHSGNIRLRVNIFAGILFSCAKNAMSSLTREFKSLTSESFVAKQRAVVPAKPPAGKQGSSKTSRSVVSPSLTPLTAVDTALDSSTADTNGRWIFHKIYTNALIEEDDPSLLSSYLAVLSHLLSFAYQLAQAQVQVQATEKLEEGELGQFDDGITVLVTDTDGNLVKMLCPATVLQTHKQSALRDILRTEVLYKAGDVSVNRDHISGEFRDMIVRDWDSDLLVLKLGSYDIWQEVFSHLSHEYLLACGVQRLSVNMLLGAYRLAHIFELSDLSRMYVSQLMAVLAADNALQIFGDVMSVELYDRSKRGGHKSDGHSDIDAIPWSTLPFGFSSHLQLYFCCGSLQFICENIYTLKRSIVFEHHNRQFLGLGNRKIAATPTDLVQLLCDITLFMHPS